MRNAAFQQQLCAFPSFLAAAWSGGNLGVIIKGGLDIHADPVQHGQQFLQARRIGAAGMQSDLEAEVADFVDGSMEAVLQGRFSAAEYDCIQQSLAALLSGRTTFIIAQRLRSVQMADSILVLKDGRIVEQGTHEQLLAGNGFYRQLYNLQFQYQEGWSEPVVNVDAEEPPATPVPESVNNGPTPHGPGHLSSSLTGSDGIVFGKAYDSRLMRRLALYLRPYWRQVALSFVAIIVGAAISAAAGEDLRAFRADEWFWIDVGSPEKLERLRARLG